MLSQGDAHLVGPFEFFIHQRGKVCKGRGAGEQAKGALKQPGRDSA
jgi:hypothetical protein